MSRPAPPGLQAERTRLAWERTALAAFVTAVLLALRVGTAPAPSALLPPAAAVVMAVALAVIGRRRGRRLAEATRSAGTASVPAATAAVTATGLGAAALGALVVVLTLR